MASNGLTVEQRKPLCVRRRAPIAAVWSIAPPSGTARRSGRRVSHVDFGLQVYAAIWGALARRWVIDGVPSSAYSDVHLRVN